MHMTMELVRTQPRSETDWKSPVAGLWVASRDGGFVGMVERKDARYLATDALARDIGSFEELDEAQSSVSLAPLNNARGDRDLLVTRITIIVSGAAALLLACGILMLAQ